MSKGFHQQCYLSVMCAVLLHFFWRSLLQWIQSLLYDQGQLKYSRCSVTHALIRKEREGERRSQGLTGNAITVCLGIAFLNSMVNFTAILLSQQVISNHNEHLNVFTRSRAPFVVLSPGHLILLIIYKLFKLYTGAAGSYKSLEEAHGLHVCGILSFKHCVNRYRVPYMLSFLFKGCRRTVKVDTVLTVCCQGLR